MPPQGRLGDKSQVLVDGHGCPTCPHPGVGPAVQGSPNVLVNDRPAVRVGDKGIHMLCCGSNTWTAVRGSATVLINNKPAHRMGDTDQHCGGVGQLVEGSPNVLVGDQAGGGGGPYATQEEAARAALQAANPASISENREFSGLIYRGADGQYYYTGPARGTDTGANPYADAPAPAGTQVVGDYHTHGDYSTADPVTGAAVATGDPAQDDFDSDNFSTTDRTGIKSDGAGIPGYRGYLGTPSGTFREYDPATGNEGTL